MRGARAGLEADRVEEGSDGDRPGVDRHVDDEAVVALADGMQQFLGLDPGSVGLLLEHVGRAAAGTQVVVEGLSQDSDPRSDRHGVAGVVGADSVAGQQLAIWHQAPLGSPRNKSPEPEVEPLSSSSGEPAATRSPSMETSVQASSLFWKSAASSLDAWLPLPDASRS